MSTINTDVFIIGGGPAGMFAAFNCGLLGMRAVLVECLCSLGGQCMQVYKDKLIHDIPGFAKIKAGDFIHHLEEQLNQFSCISYIFSQQITNIQKVEAGFQAIINDITVISKKVIFATGAGKMIPNKPNLPNLNPLERLGHVKYFIEKLEIFKDKVIAVLGGGDSAGDWCLSLLPYASKVFLIHRRQTLRITKSVYNQITASGICETLLSTEVTDLQVLHNSDMIEISHTNGKIEVDYVVPCYGMSPEPSFVNDIGLKLDNRDRIIVNPTTCESDVNSMYAIGEACSYDWKRCLISVGMAEAVKAVYHAHSQLHPDAEVRYSTSILGSD